MWMNDEPEAEVAALDTPSLDELLEFGPSSVPLTARGEDVIVRDRESTLPEPNEEVG